MSGLAREFALLNAVLRTNLPQMGWPVASVLLSDVAVATTSGFPTLYVNYTHAAGGVVTNDAAVFVMLNEMTAQLPTSMRQLDHSPGMYVLGACMVRILSESPANWTGTHAKLVFDVLHIARGIYGAAVELGFSANGNVIALTGVAAGADANVPTSFAVLSPGGFATAGQL